LFLWTTYHHISAGNWTAKKGESATKIALIIKQFISQAGLSATGSKISIVGPIPSPKIEMKQGG